MVEQKPPSPPSMEVVKYFLSYFGQRQPLRSVLRQTSPTPDKPDALARVFAAPRILAPPGSEP